MARELREADVDEIALVDKAANKKKFLFFKRKINTKEGGDQVSKKIQELSEGMEQLIETLEDGEAKQKLGEFRKEFDAFKTEYEKAESKRAEMEKAQYGDMLKSIDDKLSKLMESIDKLVKDGKYGKYPEKKSDEEIAKELKERDSIIEELANTVQELSAKMVTKEDIETMVKELK